MSICDICNEKINTDNHHIQSKVYDGPDIKWNKCQICPNCHRQIHTGFIIIEAWVASTGSTGQTLIWRKKGEPSITGISDPKVWLYKRG